MSVSSRIVRLTVFAHTSLMGWGGRRGIGRWERRLTSLREWTFIVDLLPRGCTTASYEYRALHREARNLASAGLIQMMTLHKGRKRTAVGPVGQPYDLLP